jgi:hypothetical protein
MISDETYAAAKSGYMTESDLEQQLSRRLIGCEPIAGIFVEGRLMSIWDASRQQLIKPGNALELMEAQVVSTGALIDAIDGKLTVSDAIENGIIDVSTGDALKRSLIAYNGDKEKNSLKAMMSKGSLAESKALRHLEIQIACGGVIGNSNLLIQAFYFYCRAKNGTILFDSTIVRRGSFGKKRPPKN